MPGIGIYGSNCYEGGIYNVLSSFSTGFYKALNDESVDAKFMADHFMTSSVPDLTISFNGTGSELWSTYLRMNVPHILWSVDSLFMHLEPIKQLYTYPNFIFGCVSYSDLDSIKKFFPNMPFMYLPHGVDPELWYPDNSEKEFDIVFLASVQDYEKKLSELKEKSSKKEFEQIMNLYEYAMGHPEKSFWEVYAYFAGIYNYDLSDISRYHYFYSNLCYTITYAKRVQLVKNLKNFNVKVWGSPQWEKYMEGNLEYMGSAELMESIKIVNKSKIVLHLQPLQILHGLHERILNASAANAFVISDNSPVIQESFKDSMAYYNNYSFENLEDTINYYLTNDDERIEKAARARKITLKNHTWNNRVELLMDSLFNK